MRRCEPARGPRTSTPGMWGTPWPPCSAARPPSTARSARTTRWRFDACSTRWSGPLRSTESLRAPREGASLHPRGQPLDLQVVRADDLRSRLRGNSTKRWMRACSRARLTSVPPSSDIFRSGVCLHPPATGMRPMKRTKTVGTRSRPHVTAAPTANGQRLTVSGQRLTTMMCEPRAMHAALADAPRWRCNKYSRAPPAPKMTPLHICKFAVKADHLDDLVRLGTLTRQAARFLEACVVAGPNILVSGGTQAGNPADS